MLNCSRITMCFRISSYNENHISISNTIKNWIKQPIKKSMVIIRDATTHRAVANSIHSLLSNTYPLWHEIKIITLVYDSLLHQSTAELWNKLQTLSSFSWIEMDNLIEKEESFCAWTTEYLQLFSYQYRISMFT